MNILVTGGYGFIGSSLVRYLIKETDHHVVNIDKLTYAGNLDSLPDISDCERYTHEEIDICDSTALARVFQQHEPHGCHASCCGEPR